MTNLNVKFTEDEFYKLNMAKARAGMEWHEFVLLLVHIKVKPHTKARR